MKVKTKAILIIFVAIVICIIHSKSYALSSECVKIIDNVKYFNATLYDYDPTEFNRYARGIPWSIFSAVSAEQRYEFDQRFTMLGTIFVYQYGRIPKWCKVY